MRFAARYSAAENSRDDGYFSALYTQIPIQEISPIGTGPGLEGTRAAMAVDLTIVLPQIHLNNSFRFGKGPHPREAHFAVYTAIQKNSLQNRQQRFYTKGGLRNNVPPLVVEQKLDKQVPSTKRTK